jgi:hypothetical protein
MSRVARVLTVGFFGEEADVFYPREPGLHQNRNGATVLSARVHGYVNSIHRAGLSIMRLVLARYVPLTRFVRGTLRA